MSTQPKGNSKRKNHPVFITLICIFATILLTIAVFTQLVIPAQKAKLEMEILKLKQANEEINSAYSDAISANKVLVESHSHLISQLESWKARANELQQVLVDDKDEPLLSLDKDITDIYNNILIGELFPSGNVYLERISLEGGIGNQQNLEGFSFAKQLEIYPIQKVSWDLVRASFSQLVKDTYIGEIEKNSKYFSYPFSQPSQDALLYTTTEMKTDTPITVVSINNYKIEQMVYFDDSDLREYSPVEYETAMAKIKEDHEWKDNYDATLAKIAKDNTLLNARKLALFHIESVDYDVLLSVYNTHGIEYVSTVYVIDFVKNKEVLFTKEKYNTDGPY